MVIETFVGVTVDIKVGDGGCDEHSALSIEALSLKGVTPSRSGLVKGKRPMTSV